MFFVYEILLIVPENININSEKINKNTPEMKTGTWAPSVPIAKPSGNIPKGINPNVIINMLISE